VQTIHEQTVIVVIHPALGVPGAYYSRLAKHLCERNDWIVAVQEQRGQGSSSWRASRTCNWSYWTPVALDFHLHLQLLRDSYPKNPIFLLGHSVGFVLWSLWLAKMTREKNEEALANISGLLGICSGSIYYGIHPSNTLLMRSLIITFISNALGWFPGERMGFGGQAEARGFMHDWCRSIWQDDQQPYECPHPHIMKTFKELKIPIRLMTLDNDEFTPPISTEKMAARFNPYYTSYHTIESKGELEYKDLPGDQAHVKWARGKAILPYIEGWIKQTLQSNNTPSETTATHKQARL